MRIEYTITFLTYWHCGSGDDGGRKVDMQPIKDRNGLPFVPGRTIKGHLREAAEEMYGANCKTLLRCFGREPKSTESTPAEETEAACFFSDAVLSETIEPSLVSYLFDTIATTAMDEKGLAKEKALREIEVAVPLRVRGFIECHGSDEKGKKMLLETFKAVKRIGLWRHRGLGACVIEEVQQ
jgi:CRISPR/Cas system CSM-associated protein Csm3 (group 7 of RAMP superfamily)